MLYERLVRDLTAAEQALGSGDAAAASQHLLHAQEIVIELRGSLKPERWEGGPKLAALYGYLLSELIGANVSKDAARVAACRALVEPLCEAWQGAAAQQASAAGVGALA